VATKIVVPLDGSPLAEAVLPAVRQFARRTPVEVTLVAVATLPSNVGQIVQFQPSLLFGAPGSELERLVEAEQTRLRAYLAERAAELAAEGIPTTTQVRRGEPATEILRCAEEQGADGIWMSTHGRTGLDQLLHGSVAGEVLRGARVPVTLVRPAPEAFAARSPRR
jgi:nucleotide-binding universal stress UspA family protein